MGHEIDRRDYFAIMILQGILANPEAKIQDEAAIERAYAAADNMIKLSKDTRPPKFVSVHDDNGVWCNKHHCVHGTDVRNPLHDDQLCDESDWSSLFVIEE